MKILIPAFKCMIIALCIFSILSNTIKPPAEDFTKNGKGYSWEQYDSSLFWKFQSINDLISAADQNFAPSERHTLAYYEFINLLIEKRFYHQYSNYSIADNALSFLAGKFLWNNLSAIVIPDDLMKHPMAACSQQSIILMEVFKRQGVDFRKIIFNPHFALEGKINGKWYYFDPNLEPDFQNKRESFQELVADGKFKSAYSHTGINSFGINRMMHGAVIGKINEAPAPRAALFHKLTKFLVSRFFIYLALTTMILLTLPLNIFRKVYLKLQTDEIEWAK